MIPHILGPGDDKRDQECLEMAAHWLMVLRSEELSPESVSEWLDWRQADPANLTAFERVEALSLGLNALEAHTKVALLQRTLKTAVPGHGVRRLRRIPLYAMAASLAIVVISASVLFVHRSGSLHTTYVTARTQNRVVELPDGSRVDVGARTRIDVNFSAGQRSVALINGEAFFSVKHNPSRPFVVHAGTLLLTDVGTSFDVLRAGAYVAVSVAEGVVDVQKFQPVVQRPAGARVPLPRIIRVRAGQRVTADQLDNAPVIAKVAADQIGTWRTGKLTFQDAPLSVVISNINRYATREVVIVDPAVGKMRFTGTVLEDRIDEWVAGTVDLFGLRAEPSADGKLLLYAHRSKAHRTER